MLIKAIISVDRRSQYVLSYLLYDLLSVSSFHCNTLNSSSLRFSLCLLIIWTEFLLGGAGSLAVLAQYVMQCRLTSVLSKCKITIVPLSHLKVVHPGGKLFAVQASSIVWHGFGNHSTSQALVMVVHPFPLCNSILLSGIQLH